MENQTENFPSYIVNLVAFFFSLFFNTVVKNVYIPNSLLFSFYFRISITFPLAKLLTLPSVASWHQ